MTPSFAGIDFRCSGHDMLLAWPSKPSPSHVPLDWFGLVWFGARVCYTGFVIIDMLET
ncbi:hypothetical protein ACSS6W_002537 [Trichoderma asperelloides]